MALPKELLMRLSADEPLSKRLKLAENAYCSTDLAITGKQDIIVQWLCKIAPTQLHVWKNLSFCMNRKRSNNRDSLLHETKRILIDTIIDGLKLRHEDVPDQVLDTCNEVLSTPDIQQYLQANIDKLCNLLSELFRRIKSADDIPAKEKHVIKAVESLVYMYKQSSEKDKLADETFSHVLGPLCALIDRTCKDKSNRIGAEAHKCIQQILFGKARYKEYKEYSEGKDGGYLPPKLFVTIGQLASEMDADDLQVILSCVFGAAVGSYKNDSLLIDNLFRGFINSSGTAAHNVFNCIVEYLTDVPLDYENKIDDISLTKYLENLIDESIARKKFSDVEYDLLYNISHLNPLVIENKLPIIFKRILLEKRKTESSMRCYVRLMIGILNASSKLRREQKLIPWLLLALESALGENKDCNLSAEKILPNEFCSKFTLLVSRLQNAQIVAIAKSFKFHLKSNCVDKYGKESENQICLMTECTASLLISFFEGIRIYEYVVPLALQQKFVATLDELKEVVSTLSQEILKNPHDGRLLPVLFDIAVSFIKIQSLINTFAPESAAAIERDPISNKDLKKLISVVKDSQEKSYKNALNNFLLHRIKLDFIEQRSTEKITSLFSQLEDVWPILIESYPELITLLNVDQLSDLASLILKDVLATDNSSDKWREIIEREILHENDRFHIAILCHAFRIIGSVIQSSASAVIISRINLNKVLENYTEDAAVPALSRKRPINDIVLWSNLNELDSSKIRKCLEILLCLPLSWLSVPLRTMIFVTTYVIGRELESDKEIKRLCEEILKETVEEGAMNVFEYIDMTSLMPRLPDSEVLQKVFNMSLRNSEPSSSLEHLVRLDSCPEQAVPVVLSCIDNVKPKLNNEQKLLLCKVEKKLIKKNLSGVEKISKSAQKTRSITIALKAAVGRNRVKEKLKESVKQTLLSIFMDDCNEAENSLDKNGNSDSDNELMKAGFELATIALQHRMRLDFPEELIAGIWSMVLKYPQTKLLAPLLEATLPALFKQILASLQTETERDLRTNDITRLNNTLEIWNFVIKTDMRAAKNKFRLDALRKLLQLLQVLEISSVNWPDLTKLLLTIVNAAHMQLSGEYIDMITATAAKSLIEGNLPVYDDVLVLCLALLRAKIQVMSDRLPILLQLYGKAVRLIIREAKKDEFKNNHQLALCVLNVEKVSEALVKLKRDMLRICPYVIADLVTDFSGSDVQPAAKESFKICVNHLLSICDLHGVNLLYRSLPAAKREIFKDLYETYKKFHRFTGKI